MAFAKQQNTDNVSVKLLVPYEKLGYVVGEEGAILRWLMDNFGVITEVGTENIQGDHVFMIHGPKANVLQAARQTVSLLDTQASVAAQQPQAALPIPAPPPTEPAPLAATAEAQQLAQYQQQLYAQPDAAQLAAALQPQPQAAAAAAQLTPQQQLEYLQLQQAAAAGAAA